MQISNQILLICVDWVPCIFRKSLFRKGKIICFEAMTPSSTFQNVFKTLGDSWETVAKDFAILGHFYANYINARF